MTGDRTASGPIRNEEFKKESVSNIINFSSTSGCHFGFPYSGLRVFSVSSHKGRRHVDMCAPPSISRARLIYYLTLTAEWVADEPVI